MELTSRYYSTDLAPYLLYIVVPQSLPIHTSNLHKELDVFINLQTIDHGEGHVQSHSLGLKIQGSWGPFSGQ